MNTIDRKIVKALIEDSRQSITDLSKTSGISRPTIIKRLNKMINDKTIKFNTAINLNTFGFKTACIGIEVEGRENKKKLKDVLDACPRVMMVLTPFGKVTFHVVMYGENTETLRSTIYGLEEIPHTHISYVHYSNAPLIPETFPINLPSKKGDITPCGRSCIKCWSYVEKLCCGCPSVNEYRGDI